MIPSAVSITLSRPLHHDYCASALSRAIASAAGPVLRGVSSWEHLLSPEELAPSCGLGLLCASNVEACAAAITRQTKKPKWTPVVWALILGSHDWVSGFYYTQATPNSSIHLYIGPDVRLPDREHGPSESLISPYLAIYITQASKKVVFSLPRVDDDTLIAMSKVVLATPGGLVIPMYERQRKLLAAHGASVHGAIAAPPVDVFGIFEGETSGKAQTHSWLRSHGLGEYSLAEYDPDELSVQLR